MIKKILLVAVLAVWMVCVYGCHTMEGIGGDIESAGRGIQNMAGGDDD